MAPWRKHLIEAQLEKVTEYNYDDVAKRIVMILDSRSIIQSAAHMLVQRINRWYMPSYSEELDIQKRNICDNFLASLLHAIALRTKHIKDVPTTEGLSGIPLFKSDLLSTSLHGRIRIGPVAVALYNSGNMTIDDVMELVEACLEPLYCSQFLQRISDAIIILEFTGKQMAKHNMAQFVSLMEQLRVLLVKNEDWASKRVRICDRDIPNLFQRFFDLQRTLENTAKENATKPGTVEESALSEKLNSDIYSLTISRFSEEEESLFNRTISSTAFSCSGDDDDGSSLSTIEGKYSFSEPETISVLSPALPSSQPRSAGASSLSSEIVPRAAIEPRRALSLQTRLARERQLRPSKSMILQDVFVPLQVDLPQQKLLSECLMEQIGLKVDQDKTPTVNKFDTSQIITPPLTPPNESQEETICSVVKFGKLPNVIRFFFPSSVFTKEHVDSITQMMNVELNKSGTSLIKDGGTTGCSLAIADKFQLLNDGSAFQTFHIGGEVEIDVIYSANMTLSQISGMGQRIAQVLACSAY
ncbi:uncharacterized protein FA14DRAFT_186292 [Meira miltonrushii]|uniref:Uncharacterized protein n=1 Tax=Meira miltonrushii TaxID=1280837 RepID=A0A316V6M7_9BASI|nr:uncharacterized protein FA14DRAFT_186292 [Meira miltonrushii]PWN31843.1 hypothetical protein FA14DRAFT_186292 [Meira miltonrushii]